MEHLEAINIYLKGFDTRKIDVNDTLRQPKYTQQYEGIYLLFTSFVSKMYSNIWQSIFLMHSHIHILTMKSL